jgi:predicted ATPase/DNA-binding SARP family transcriptional activator
MGLKIYLLGQFKLQWDDKTIELPSRPAQSLMAYLALNAGITQRREKLASLLWPEATEKNARSYLRQSLWRIRKSLQENSLESDEYFLVNEIEITFINQPKIWIDAGLILNRSTSLQSDELSKIVNLYRGELLPGFYEEWVAMERDRLEAAFHEKMNLLIEKLIQERHWAEVLKWSEDWIRHGQSPEPAYRSLMRAYAGLGNQSMVNSTYQRCVETLKGELGVEPSVDTKRLYDQLCHSDTIYQPPSLSHYPLAGRRPAFLEEGRQDQIEEQFFFARDRELEQLDHFLKLSISGQGRISFITGETGSGKTALIHEFCRRAQASNPDLVVATGNCNAHTGLGDPYLPFREILRLLTGDVETHWTAGAITIKHARLLWYNLPNALQAIVQVGPDLVDTFVPGFPLLERARNSLSLDADWFPRLEKIIERKTINPGNPSLIQNDLFEQYTQVVQNLAHKVPLLIVLDDLQWADLGSISLLFHLGRHLAGSPILIVGAYRSEEIALGREGSRHPLEQVVNEFQRLFGDITVNVDQAEGRNFMDHLLDSEPNQLQNSFRHMLYQQTHGHPLFTIELLRGMQERGDLVLNQAGQWSEGSALDWDTLPARVEAVISERISRLADPIQAALRVASVEGETFTAEVVARVRNLDEKEIADILSNELTKKHRLIRAQNIMRINNQLLSRYRFQHILYQKYLYSSLDENERVRLHEQVGKVMEDLYAADQGTVSTSDIAPQLARHFQEARITEKAIHYLHQAGDRAIQVSAYQEGVTHLVKGLDLLMTLPDSPERTQQEMILQLYLGISSMGTGSIQGEKAYLRARQLCEQLGNTSQLIQALDGLAVLYYVRANYREAQQLAEEAFRLAQQTGDHVLISLSHWYLGFILFGQGHYVDAREHMIQVIESYNFQKHHQIHIRLRGSDAGISAMAYDACCLWCLGYPDQALKRSQESMDLARNVGHTFTLADVLAFAGCVIFRMRQDPLALKKTAEEILMLPFDTGAQSWLAAAACYQGEAMYQLGEVEAGIETMQQGIEAQETRGVHCYISGTIGTLARALVASGNFEAGITKLKEGLALIETTGEHHWETELYRLQAELLIMQGKISEAEASLLHALEVARKQNAKSWELRVVLDLARLWQTQDLPGKGRQLVQEVYAWFTEGFDTPDLKEAQRLLEELS